MAKARERFALSRTAHVERPQAKIVATVCGVAFLSRRCYWAGQLSADASVTDWDQTDLLRCSRDVLYFRAVSLRKQQKEVDDVRDERQAHSEPAFSESFLKVAYEVECEIARRNGNTCDSLKKGLRQTRSIKLARALRLFTPVLLPSRH